MVTRKRDNPVKSLLARDTALAVFYEFATTGQARKRILTMNFYPTFNEQVQHFYVALHMVSCILSTYEVDY
jgi:hypothetical protein